MFSYDVDTLKEPFSLLPPKNTIKERVLPEEFDYRALGKVSKVKNQGICGVGGVFAAVGMVESQLLIKGEEISELSEQYVLECLQDADCISKSPYEALESLAEKGIPEEWQYPYKSEFSENKFESNLGYSECQQNIPLIETKFEASDVKHYANVDTETLKILLYENGPLVTSISGQEILWYEQGVAICKKSIPDHSVLLVGWTSDSWIIKNSWGEQWGSEGYAYVKFNNCGIGKIIDVIESSQSSEKEQISITLTDSYGNGWTPTLLALSQKSKIVYVLGDNFHQGSLQGPFYAEIPKGIETQVIVGILGNNSEQIGFKISSLKRNSESQKEEEILCERKPGKTFEFDDILCEFCLNCEEEITEELKNEENLQKNEVNEEKVSKENNKNSLKNKENFTIVLESENGNGWNGTVIALKQKINENGQNEETIELGPQFMGGKKYGPRTYTFLKKIPVEVSVVKPGTNLNSISIKIRDMLGNIVFENKINVNDSLAEESILGTFCPSCKNPSSFKIRPVSSPLNLDLNTSPPKTSLPEESKFNKKPYIIAISILSVVFIILLSVFSFLFFSKKGKNIFNKQIEMKEFQGVSVMGSTATVPDENEIDRSAEINNSHEYKLN